MLLDNCNENFTEHQKDVRKKLHQSTFCEQQIKLSTLISALSKGKGLRTEVSVLYAVYIYIFFIPKQKLNLNSENPKNVKRIKKLFSLICLKLVNKGLNIDQREITRRAKCC